MATVADVTVSNDTGANVRTDLNNIFSAVVSQFSNTTEHTTMYAYMWWADTTTGILKQRNSANSAWISILTLATGVPIAGAGGPSLGVDSVIRTNAKTITASITFAGTENGMSAGPVSISGAGVSVTVTSGSTWTIV